MYKVLFGILFGILLTTFAIYAYRTWWLRDYIVKPLNIENRADTSKLAMQQSIMQLNMSNAGTTEKFEAVNKRLDDFLVFGGIIITLLLAVTVSVYLKTETEVTKHFKENFSSHIKTIEDYEKRGGELLGKIEVISEKAEQSIKQQKLTTNVPSNER